MPTELIDNLSLSPFEWCLVILGALLIGMSKGGLPGTGGVTIWLYAQIFEAKESVGLLLPILIVADVYAVIVYRRHVEYALVKRLAPLVVVGALIGTALFNLIPADDFGRVIGVLLILMVVIHFIAKSKTRKSTDEGIHVPRWVEWLVPVSSGTCSMLANAGSPILAFYLMMRRLPKMLFLGTFAWLVLLSNGICFPLHLAIHSMTLKSLPFSFLLGTLTIIGVLAAKRIVQFIPQKQFEYFIWTIITLSGVNLLL